MAAEGYVDIVHTETGLTASVIASTVPAWETAGWTRTDNGDEESGTQQPPQIPSSNQDADTPIVPADATEE